MESRAIFTSRSGGKSGTPYGTRNLALHVGDDPELVRQNREDLAHELSIASERLFFMEQNHGVDIQIVDEASDHRKVRTCDALVTSTPQTALAVLVADCAPLLIRGERSSAAVHVGWRGLFGGIVEKVLERFAEERFSASIGATICGECYQIGEDLLSQAQERGFVTGAQTLDIPRSILKILHEQSGNRLIAAQWNGICTFESNEHFSYRREGRTGRQAGVVIHGS